MIKLQMIAPLGGPQSEFEHAAHHHLGLNHGIFAIAACETKYVNKNVQWLWVQFQKAKVHAK